MKQTKKPRGNTPKLFLLAVCFIFLFLTTACNQTQAIQVREYEVIKYVELNRTILVQDPTYCIRIFEQAKQIREAANG